MNKLSVISDNSYNGHSDITDEFVRSRGVRYIRGLLYLTDWQEKLGTSSEEKSASFGWWESPLSSRRELIFHLTQIYDDGYGDGRGFQILALLFIFDIMKLFLWIEWTVDNMCPNLLLLLLLFIWDPHIYFCILGFSRLFINNNNITKIRKKWCGASICCRVPASSACASTVC